MRQILCGFYLCLCMLGCASGMSPKAKELLVAINQIPFPPGYTIFRFDDEVDTPTSYSVRVEYPAGTTGLLEHYKKYFEENGWEKTSVDDDDSVGSLDYRKGKATLYISTMDMKKNVTLVIMYREEKHTWEEFGALVDISASLEAKDLIAKVLKLYGTIETYADTGHQETVSHGELLSTLDFKTNFISPSDFLFEYSDALTNGFKTSTVLTKSGDVIQAMVSYDSAPEIYPDISRAIGALYGVSHRTSGNIPELLFDLKDKTLFNLINLTKIGESNLDDGTICLRLRGEDFIGKEVKIWISKESYLIRKIEEVTDERNRSTTTYEPKINLPIEKERLKFYEPKEPS